MRRNSCDDYIKKHRPYIDYRIEFLNNYVSSLDENDIKPICGIIGYLTGHIPHNRQFYDDKCGHSVALDELKNLVNSWDILRDGDILGYIYQGLQSKTAKKAKGQFFTPSDIVEFILGKSFSECKKDNPVILDPACGTGQFLIAAVRLAAETAAGSIEYDKNILRSIIEERIFGFDSDPVAVKIALFNLHKISGCDINKINIRCVDFLDRNWCEKNYCNLPRTEFDIIAGNPPWGSSIPAEQKSLYRKKYRSALSGINTFTLFIERSFDFLSPSGIISFLIPDAYLNIKAHKNSRHLVLEKAMVRSIALWGERFKNVFAPSISILLKHEEDPSRRSSNIVEIAGPGPSENTVTLVPQESFQRTHENIFNINYSRRAVNIISSIENGDCLFLKDRARFFLGIVTGNNELHIAQEKSKQYPDPIIIGRDIDQYRISFSNHYFRYCPDTLQQVAPRHLYQAHDKILYKFIGRRLTFALDRNGYYSLNNVNGFIPDTGELNIESTLSILNSRVIQYYYEKNYFTIKVLRGNLERLPLKKIGRENQKKLKKYTGSILEIGNRTSSTDRSNIEDIIFYEYGIRDREAYLISDSVEPSVQAL